MAITPDQLRYHLGKIVEAAYHHKTELDSRGLGPVNLNMIEDNIAKLVAFVQTPEIAVQWKFLKEELRLETELLKHSIAELRAFFDNENPTDEERLSAKVFAMHINDYTLKFFETFRQTGTEP